MTTPPKTKAQDNGASNGAESGPIVLAGTGGRREPGVKVSYVAIGTLAAVALVGVELWSRSAGATTAGEQSARAAGEKDAQAAAVAKKVDGHDATLLDHEKRLVETQTTVKALVDVVGKFDHKLDRLLEEKPAGK